MSKAFKATLCRDEDGQLLEFPPGLDIPFIDLVLQKDGDKLTIEPADPADLSAWNAAFDAFDPEAANRKGL